MMKDSKLFEDMAKMATSAAGTFMDMKREIEASVHSHIESYLARTSLVTRDEFEVVKAMAEKARSENEALRAELEALKSSKGKKS